MSRKSRAAVCLILAFLIVGGTGLTGCRRSEVLEQKIYTENQEIDRENETKIKENEEENLNEDQDITSKKETENAQTERKQSDSLSTKGSGNQGSTAAVEYGENASANGTAQNSGSGESRGTDKTGAGITETTENTEASSGELQTVSDDDNAETIEIPDTCSKIAAVGSAAVFVEMFGGQGMLKASSESFTGSSLIQSAFPSDAGSVQTLWSGDGSAGLNEGGIDQLITLLTADSSGTGACLYDTGVLSPDDVQRLEAAEIRTYPISLAQNSSTAYKEQVTAIGDILGGDAADKARQYCSWYDSVIGKAGNGAADSKYTLFISAWDPDASWFLYSTAAELAANYGLAIAPSKKLVKLFNEYLSAAGVTNRVVSIGDLSDSGQYWYVNPLLDNQYKVKLPETANASVHDEQASNKLTSVPDEEAYLGDSGFPAIITAESSVAQSISGERGSGSGLWSVYPYTQAGQVWGYGFVLENGSFIQSTIHNDYDIHVLPQGLTGNWASGTPEGVLSAMWAASHFGGGVTEDDVKTELENFNREFCDGNLSSETIDSMLAG